MVIYKITNAVNSKVYVGQTRQKPRARWLSHRCKLRTGKHANQHLQHAWNKYGEDSFGFEVIDSAFDVFDMNNLERYWIGRLNSMSEQYGYNLESGGGAGKTSRPETNEKKRKSLIGRTVTIETRAKIGEALSGPKHWAYGKKQSPEYVKRRIENTKWNIGPNNPRFGKPGLRLGVKCSPEHRAKIGKAKRKQVLCVTNNTIYDSTLAVEAALGLCASAVSKVCLGHRKQSNGYVFKYI